MYVYDKVFIYVYTHTYTCTYLYIHICNIYVICVWESALIPRIYDESQNLVYKTTNDPIKNVGNVPK